MRLADYIALNGISPMKGSSFESGEDMAWVRRSLPDLTRHIAEAEVIVADEPARYWYQHHIVNSEERWNPVDDLPTAAPVYQRYLVEWRRPDRLELPDFRRTPGKTGEFYRLDMPPLVGTYFESQRIDTMSDKDALKTRAKWPGACWTTIAVSLAFMHDDFPVAILGMHTLAMDDTGRLIAAGRDKDGVALVDGVANIIHMPQSETPEGWRAWCYALNMSVMLPCLFTTCLMHSDNVAVRDERPNPKLNKRYQARHKRPMVTFKTLDIRPMVRVLKDEGKSETEGLRKALHTVRACFRDYRGGAGLFGKVHGVWWFQEHERGSAESGVVVKDYRVRMGDDDGTHA